MDYTHAAPPRHGLHWMTPTTMQRDSGCTLSPCCNACSLAWEPPRRSLLHTPHGTPLDVVLQDVVRDVAALDQPLVLVMDDYHLIDTEALHSGVAFLLERESVAVSHSNASVRDGAGPSSNARITTDEAFSIRGR
jgi:hypothetical protein